MGRDFRIWMFIAVAFLLGSINGLYGIAFYIFLMGAFLVNLKCDFKGFCANFRKEWKYMILPVVGVVYLCLHYVGTLIFSDPVPYESSWGMMELLLLYFFLLPLYVLSARNFVTPLLLRRSLFALCWGILLFNFVKMFYLTGFALFTEPVQSLNMLYFGRFGGNMGFWGGFMYLEPQAIYLSVSALIAYFFLLKQMLSLDNKCVLYSSVVIFIFSLLFLSFTVTKGSILAFLGGFLLLSFFYFRAMSRRLKFIGGGIGIILIVGIYFLASPIYIQRMKDMKQEIVSVQAGTFQGGSIGPRAGLIKENFSHFDQFGLWGLGVYKKEMTKEWYEHSPYIGVWVSNSHNTFVDFWLTLGVFGLFFLLYFFFVPIVRMRKRKQYSYLSIAIIVALFVGNNTCILIVLVDSSPFVIWMLSMAFLYSDQFYRLQTAGTIDRSEG
ncbi:MAG: O-antigen ligase family protein [Odoribacter sp.]